MKFGSPKDISRQQNFQQKNYLELQNGKESTQIDTLFEKWQKNLPHSAQGNEDSEDVCKASWIVKWSFRWNVFKQKWQVYL